MSVPTSRVDIRRSRYPFCVVWTPLPLISWFIPVIGHVGIATSTGIIRDFAGSYYVSEDEMAFGEPTRYWPLVPHKVTLKLTGGDSCEDIVSFNQQQPGVCGSHLSPENGPEREPLSSGNTESTSIQFSIEDCAAVYNEAVAVGSSEYSKREHNLIFDNCHSHVARCFNLMGYEGRRDWTMVQIALRIMKEGVWVSTPRALKTLLPSVVFLCVVIILLTTLI